MSNGRVNWDEVRAQFPALANYTYLNSATYGQLPQPRGGGGGPPLGASRRICLLATSSPGSMMPTGSAAWLAQLIRCDAADIAFVPNASLALATVLNGLEWNAGDRILTLAGEFPNNLYAPAVVGRGVSVVEAEPGRPIRRDPPRRAAGRCQLGELLHRLPPAARRALAHRARARGAALRRRHAEHRRACASTARRSSRTS